MDTLETNVAKIHIGNSKQTNTYVAVMAERAGQPDCELFAVVSLPVLNPAALDDCERISSAVLASLRRCYKRAANENTFETALGEINDEIGKLSSLGQHSWTGKLSAVLAVRRGNLLTVAATGKTNALLFRDNEFNEVTESTNAKHPLKTFDTFSTGRIKVDDVLIMSTTELFNHISVDRIKNIINNNTLEIGAQEIVRILEDTAGPEVAFGTLLLHETEPLVASVDGITLNEYSSNTDNTLLGSVAGQAKQLLSKDTVRGIWNSVRTATSKRPSLHVKRISDLAGNSAQSLLKLKEHAQNYKQLNMTAPVTVFRGFSRSKKFFTISVLVLLLAVVINIFVARGRRDNAATTNAFEQTMTNVRGLLADADSKLVFKDESAAAGILAEAKQILANTTPTDEDQEKAKADLESQVSTLQKRVEKIETPSVTTLATLSSSERLITLPNLLATATGKVVVSFNTNTNTTEDGALKTTTDILDSIYLSGTNAAVFDGQGLSIWNFSTGVTGAPTFLNVPKANNFVGLVRYPVNNRIYTVDTSAAQVTSYLVTGSSISKPIASVKDSELSGAQDLAVDGSIYVLTRNGISKYTAGKPAAFTFPTLTEPYSGTGSIYTSQTSKHLFILDSNGRVIVTDKTGKLVLIYQSPELQGASDFTVDETTSTIYLLKNGSLLKFNFTL